MTHRSEGLGSCGLGGGRVSRQTHVHEEPLVSSPEANRFYLSGMGASTLSRRRSLVRNCPAVPGSEVSPSAEGRGGRGRGGCSCDQAISSQAAVRQRRM